MAQQGMTRQALKLLLYLSDLYSLARANEKEFQDTEKSSHNKQRNTYWEKALRLVKTQADEVKQQELFHCLLAHAFSSPGRHYEKESQFSDLWAVLPKKLSPLSLLELFQQECDHLAEHKQSKSSKASEDKPGYQRKYQTHKETDVTLGIITSRGGSKEEAADGKELPLSMLKTQLLKMLGTNNSNATIDFIGS